MIRSNSVMAGDSVPSSLSYLWLIAAGASLHHRRKVPCDETKCYPDMAFVQARIVQQQAAKRRIEVFDRAITTLDCRYQDKLLDLLEGNQLKVNTLQRLCSIMECAVR